MIRSEVVCDRCGETAEMGEDGVTPEGWDNGIIYLRGLTPSDLDLCPDCVSSLTEWWRCGDSARRGLAEQQDAGGFVVSTSGGVPFNQWDRVQGRRIGTVTHVYPVSEAAKVVWDDGPGEIVRFHHIEPLVEP